MRTSIIFIDKIRSKNTETISAYNMDTDTYFHFNKYFKRMEQELRGHHKRKENIRNER